MHIDQIVKQIEDSINCDILVIVPSIIFGEDICKDLVIKNNLIINYFSKDKLNFDNGTKVRFLSLHQIKNGTHKGCQVDKILIEEYALDNLTQSDLDSLNLCLRKEKLRKPREWEVVSCFDCGYTGNRVDEIKDTTQTGEEFIDHSCPECGESCGPWIKVKEIMEY